MQALVWVIFFHLQFDCLHCELAIQLGVQLEFSLSVGIMFLGLFSNNILFILLRSLSFLNKLVNIKAQPSEYIILSCHFWHCNTGWSSRSSDPSDHKKSAFSNGNFKPAAVITFVIVTPVCLKVSVTPFALLFCV